MGFEILKILSFCLRTKCIHRNKLCHVPNRAVSACVTISAAQKSRKSQRRLAAAIDKGRMNQV